MGSLARVPPAEFFSLTRAHARERLKKCGGLIAKA